MSSVRISQSRTGLQLVLGSYVVFTATLIIAAVLSCVTQSWEPGCNLSLGLLLVSSLQGAGIRVAISYDSAGNPVGNSITSLVFRIAPLIAGVGSVLLLLAFTVDSLSPSLFGAMALLVISFGSLGVAFCNHLPRMLGRHGHQRLSTLGRYLALCLVACGGLTAAGLTCLSIHIENDLVRASMILGLLLLPFCLVGLMVFLSLVLRFVSAEEKIARGWHEAMAARLRLLNEGRTRPPE
jgi:hypothetical protein